MIASILYEIVDAAEVTVPSLREAGPPERKKLMHDLLLELKIFRHFAVRRTYSHAGTAALIFHSLTIPRGKPLIKRDGSCQRSSRDAVARVTG